MKNEREIFQEVRGEESGMRETEAQNEAEIDARELTREILPLLKENFVAVCRLSEDGISMRFPGGRVATVAVWFEK